MARTVNVNANSIMLPDGNLYNEGDTATLTDEQFARIASGLFEGDEPLLGDGGGADIQDFEDFFLTTDGSAIDYGTGGGGWLRYSTNNGWCEIEGKVKFGADCVIPPGAFIMALPYEVHQSPNTQRFVADVVFVEGTENTPIQSRYGQMTGGDLEPAMGLPDGVLPDFICVMDITDSPEDVISAGHNVPWDWSTNGGFFKFHGRFEVAS